VVVSDEVTLGLALAVLVGWRVGVKGMAVGARVTVGGAVRSGSGSTVNPPGWPSAGEPASVERVAMKRASAGHLTRRALLLASGLDNAVDNAVDTPT
jgi:hypothetical protein